MNVMILVRSSMPSSGKDFSNIIFIYTCTMKPWLYTCVYGSIVVTLNLALANLEQDVKQRQLQYNH